MSTYLSERQRRQLEAFVAYRTRGSVTVSLSGPRVADVVAAMRRRRFVRDLLDAEQPPTPEPPCPSR